MGSVFDLRDWWIRQTIERAIMNQTRTIRLPIHIVKELNVYLRTARELSHKLDHEPSAEEIAEQLDKPVDDVSRMLRLNEHITSVDTRWVAIQKKRCWIFWPMRKRTARKTPRRTMI